MQGRDDIAGFIAGFAGDDRYIVDYLVEEVLQRQPERRPDLPAADLHPGPAERPALRRRHRPATTARPCWRRSTAATCSWSRSTTAASGIATTTSSPTCCEHTCSTSSPTTSRPCTGAPATGTSRTASRPSAIDHALAAEDFERAADLVELAIPADAAEPAGGHATSLAGGHPRGALQVRPVSQQRRIVGALMSTGEIEGVEPCLRNAERWLDADDGRWRGPHDRPPDMVVVDEEAVPQRCPRWSPCTAPGWRSARRPWPARITHARRARSTWPVRDDHVGRAQRRRSSGSRRGARATSRRRRRATPSAMAGPAAGRPHRRRPGLRDHAGGHP